MLKRLHTLVIAIPEPTPEEQVEGQARRDRESLVHALFHHPWLVHMAEGDWRRGPLVSAIPADGDQAAPVTPPADGKPAAPAEVTAAQVAATRALIGQLFHEGPAGPSPALAALRRVNIALAFALAGGGSPRDDANALPPAPADAIDHPAHYTSHPSGIEPIQITRHESFTRGNAIKYLMRAGRKDPDPRTDLRKARRYIDFELEDLERLVVRPETRGAAEA